MADTQPSVAGIARARYWTRAALRAVAFILAVSSLSHALGLAAGYLVSGEVAPLFRLIDFWQALVPFALAAAILMASDRIVRWLLPMPKPACPECGYALRDNPGRCPECGLNLARGGTGTS